MQRPVNHRSSLNLLLASLNRLANEQRGTVIRHEFARDQPFATYVARAHPGDFVAREVMSTCGKSSTHSKMFKIRTFCRRNFQQKALIISILLRLRLSTQVASTRIRIFLNPQLFLSGFRNFPVHTKRIYPDSLSNSPNACGRKPYPENKKLRIQKYPDTCGQGLSVQ